MAEFLHRVQITLWFKPRVLDQVSDIMSYLTGKCGYILHFHFSVI